MAGSGRVLHHPHAQCRRYHFPFVQEEGEKLTFYSYLCFQPEHMTGPFDTTVIDVQLATIRAVLTIAGMRNLSIGSLDLEAIYE